jgi:hypothetical protein
MDVVVYCADVGSIAQRRFAWARGTPGSRIEEDFGGGDEIADLVEEVVRDLDDGQLVALGFECPLFVPVPEDPQDLGRARPIDRDRSSSAGPGIAVLGVGLVQVPWILRAIRSSRGATPSYLRWEPTTFERPGLFRTRGTSTTKSLRAARRHPTPDVSLGGDASSPAASHAERPEISAELAQLADLHARASLTDDEFLQAKKRVLGR